MDKKTLIYPVFLSHAGCPFRCVYCNQNLVTQGRFDQGEKAAPPPPEQTIRELARQAENRPGRGEIAFYGGTFTALPESSMVRLLDTAASFVSEGCFSGIRFSTRPDRMTPRILELLSKYPVQTVEIGAQSLSDDVLMQSRRGYDAECVRSAVEAVRAGGWSAGVQLMPGLPGDSEERFRSTVAATVSLRPDFVRLYPAVVLQGTVLAEWFQQGCYQPLSLDMAISWCADAYGAFCTAGIGIARMGLHADPELLKAGSIVAGPFHPAFGHLVRAAVWRDTVDVHLGTLLKDNSSRDISVMVSSNVLSEVIGPGRANVAHWKMKWKVENFYVRGVPSVSRDFLECTLDERARETGRKSRHRIECASGDRKVSNRL